MWKDQDINFVMQAQTMGKVIGRAWLSQKCPHATDEEIEAVLSLSKDVIGPPHVPPTVTAHTDEYRRKFIAVVWLLGASQAQIAQYLRVSQQTIHKHLNKELTLYDRNQARLYWPPMQTWKIQALHTEFYNIIKSNSEIFVGYDPLQIAYALNKIPLTDPDSGPIDDYEIAAAESEARRSDPDEA